MSRGKYIVIEGHDGTGKSTQVGLLRDRLSEQGIGSIEFHEPQGVPVADAIRTVIKNGTLPRDSQTNLLLFTAARHEIWKEARKALDRGIWVIAARSYYSTIAYQGFGEGLDPELIISITKQFTDETYINPDLAVILTLENETERRRRISERGVLQTPDTFEARDMTFQSAVKNGYREIARTYALPLIPADQPTADIADAIYDLVERLEA